MSKAGATALVFVTLVASARSQVDPQAQPRPFSLMQTSDLPFGFYSGPHPLMACMLKPEVRKSLELTDEQERKYNELQTKFQAECKKVLDESGERQKALLAEGRFEEARGLERPRKVLLDQLSDQAGEALSRKILDRRRLTRLNEISLQAEGPFAFHRPEVQEKLGLFAEQITEIKRAIFKGSQLTRQASVLPVGIKRAIPGGEETPESRTYGVVVKSIEFRMADARRTTMKAIEALLTNDQRSAFLKMLGKPFPFLKLPPGPPYRVLAQDKGKVAIVDPAGVIEWEAPLKHTAHDIQLLPNGNILVPTDNVTVVEMTPEKKVVWKHVSRPKEPYKGAVEIHAFQRLPDGLTMISETGNKRIIEVDAEDKVVKEIPLVVDHPNSHRDTRRARKLANGHYLVCHELDGIVREYDEAGKVVWRYKLDLAGRTATPGHEGHGTEVFNAIRRPDGNTIIAGGNNNRVFEVNLEGKVVWSVEHDELPGITLAWVTSLQLRPNGNLIFGNTHAGPLNPQLIEVTRDKQVVWTFQDFKNFGNDLCASQVINVEEGVVR